MIDLLRYFICKKKDYSSFMMVAVVCKDMEDYSLFRESHETLPNEVLIPTPTVESAVGWGFDRIIFTENTPINVALIECIRNQMYKNDSDNI